MTDLLDSKPELNKEMEVETSVDANTTRTTRSKTPKLNQTLAPIQPYGSFQKQGSKTLSVKPIVVDKENTQNGIRKPLQKTGPKKPFGGGGAIRSSLGKAVRVPLAEINSNPELLEDGVDLEILIETDSQPEHTESQPQSEIPVPEIQNKTLEIPVNPTQLKLDARSSPQSMQAKLETSSPTVPLQTPTQQTPTQQTPTQQTPTQQTPTQQTPTQQAPTQQAPIHSSTPRAFDLSPENPNLNFQTPTIQKATIVQAQTPTLPPLFQLPPETPNLQTPTMQKATQIQAQTPTLPPLFQLPPETQIQRPKRPQMQRTGTQPQSESQPQPHPQPLVVQAPRAQTQPQFQSQLNLQPLQPLQPLQQPQAKVMQPPKVQVQAQVQSQQLQQFQPIPSQEPSISLKAQEQAQTQPQQHLREQPQSQEPLQLPRAQTQPQAHPQQSQTQLPRAQTQQLQQPIMTQQQVQQPHVQKIFDRQVVPLLRANTKVNLPPLKPLPNTNEFLQFHSFQLPSWTNTTLVVNKRPYIKISRIGKGGSSIVYKVLCEDGNIYAVKKVSLAEADASTRQSFIEEIELLKRLQKYERIIQLIDYEYNESAEFLHIILEFAEVDLARTLADFKGGLFPSHMNYLRLYWQEMLEAVFVVHSEDERIVHGDIKPQNFVFVKGHIKLIDFGIAKAIDGAHTTNIQRDNIIGTINYMAPETLKQKYGRASDIWALGCILYQMVYGKTPFQLLNLQPIQILQCLSDPNYEIQYPKCEELPRTLVDVLRKSLHKDATKRATAEELMKHPFLNQL